MFRTLCLTLILAAFVGGCNGAEPPDNPDAVATVQSQSFPFSAAKTYVLPDDVVEITDATLPAAPAASLVPLQEATLDPSTETLILNEIVAKMTERGYVRLTDPAGPKPDIFIQASVLRTTSTQVYYDYWYSYWGGYYGSWYGGAYGAGWAPVPVPYVVTSTLGTLVVEFTDPNHPDTANQKIPSVWVGLVTGTVDGASTPEVQSRIQTGLNQAFEQSPYIRSQQ